MLDNIFITGTNQDLIINLAKNNSFLNKDSLYYHTVSDEVSKDPQVSHMGIYTAPIITSYARTKLSTISTLLIYLQLPSIVAFDTEQEQSKSIVLSFNIEFFFTIDLIRQCILLMKQMHNLSTSRTLKKNLRQRIIIFIPRPNKESHTDSQKIYFDSLLTAISSIIIELKLPINIVLSVYEQLDSNTENIEMLCNSIKNIIDKKIYRKVIYNQSWLSRLWYTIKYVYR